MTQSHLQHAKDDIDYQNAEERQTVNLVAALGLTPKRDGNQWCFLYGDDLQSGVAGFGNSVRDAAIEFSRNFYKDESGEGK